jgi:hypothetical protein
MIKLYQNTMITVCKFLKNCQLYSISILIPVFLIKIVPIYYKLWKLILFTINYCFDPNTLDNKPDTDIRNGVEGVPGASDPEGGPITCT